MDFALVHDLVSLVTSATRNHIFIDPIQKSREKAAADSLQVRRCLGTRGFDVGRPVREIVFVFNFT